MPASASLLHLYDCWSAYKYVNFSRTIYDAMAYLNDTITVNSNYISMLAALKRYGDDTSHRVQGDGVLADGFMARDLTIANTAGPDAHQAVAFRSTGDRTVLDTVELLGHQDTLYVHAMRQFYTRCRVAGTVDFVFGNSAAASPGPQLRVAPRQLRPEKGETDALTAQGRTDPAQPTGIVLRGCRVNGSDEYMGFYRQKPGVHHVFLGRPWKEYSRTVFVGCTMAEIVRPEGWMPWSGDFALKTLYYGEYDSAGPGAGGRSGGGRVGWSSQVPKERVDVYSVASFIQGDEWIPKVGGGNGRPHRTPQLLGGQRPTDGGICSTRVHCVGTSGARILRGWIMQSSQEPSNLPFPITGPPEFECYQDRCVRHGKERMRAADARLVVGRGLGSKGGAARGRGARNAQLGYGHMVRARALHRACDVCMPTSRSPPGADAWVVLAASGYVH
uniref:Pectinesterase n=1 Tax=Aegilops tauschii TaxID=37682 RepID=M8BV08_AEGTA